jgi:EmrB/QacA subfamily drug resistance transporter
MTTLTTEAKPDRQGPATEQGLSREILVIGAAILVGMIMSVLDVTIVNVAIPTLGQDFHSSISTIQWVLTGYMLAFAAVIPVTGWATQRFGAKRVWMASLLVFMLGSALSGAAWSIGSLIGFRLLQGLGGGMIVPVGQTILAQAAGPKRIGRVMSVLGVPLLLAPVFGPVLGGAIVGQVSWRWIFLINLPVGVVAVALAQRLLPASAPRLGERLDLRGLLLLSPGIAALLYGMSEAGNRGGFDRPVTIFAAAAGLALVAGFVWHALARGSRSGDALIDLSLFGRRGFASAAGANFLLGVGLLGSMILLPLYYQSVRGQSPLATGLLLVPQGVGAAIAMPLAGWFTDKLGARLVVAGGIGVAMLGTAVYTQVGPDTPYAVLAAALLVVGLGLGSTIMPSMAAAFQTLSHQAIPRATSALHTIQRIAGAIGTVVLAIVLQRSIAGSLPGLHGDLQATAAMSAAERAHAAPALAGGFGTAFWVALALTATALIPALLLPRRPRPDEAGDAREPSEARDAGQTVGSAGTAGARGEGGR